MLALAIISQVMNDAAPTHETYAVLLMSMVTDADVRSDGGTNVWISMPMAQAHTHGWLLHVMDDDLGTAICVFDLSDVSDCPRCKCCGKPSISLVKVEDWSNPGCTELRCDECNEEVDEDAYDAPSPSEPDYSHDSEVCDADVREPRHYAGLASMRGVSL